MHCSLLPLKIVIKDSISLAAVHNAIRSMSVEHKAISVCNVDVQMRGHPANIIIYPEQNF
jgi:hypothetical protein